MKSLPTSTGNPPALTVKGWKIYYADSVLSSKTSEWETAPGGIQAVRVFFHQMYPIHRNGKWEMENYVFTFMEDDYYWRVGDQYFSGSAGEVPTGLPDGSVKSGLLMPYPEFMNVTNRIESDRIF